MSANLEQMKNSNLASVFGESDTYRPFQQRDGRLVYKHANHHAFDDMRVISGINPSTAKPVNLNNASIDFEINSGLVDHLNFPSLHMTLTNNTGASATVVGAPLWIDRIRIQAQNGSDTLLDFFGDELYQQFLFLDRNSYEALAPSVGLSATTYSSTGATIADTETIDLNLPIFQFFRAVQYATGFLQQPLVLKVQFRSTAMTHITGSALTLTDIELVVRGKKYSNEIKESLYEKVYTPNHKIPLSLGFLQVDRQSYPINLTASQTIQIGLNGVQGVCAFLLFTVRLASNTSSPTGQLTYVRALNWDILDTSNNSMVGAHRRSVNVQRIDWALNWGNEVFNQKNIHCMTWSANPRLAFSDGIDSGHAFLSRNERLSITFPSTLASGSYVVDIYAYVHANLQSEMGKLRIEK